MQREKVSMEGRKRWGVAFDIGKIVYRNENHKIVSL
jgi:hypothetical protein